MTHSNQGYTSQSTMDRFLTPFSRGALRTVAKTITGVKPIWKGCEPETTKTRVYYANHRSHADFVLVWSVLPRELRRLTRPVAGADYWDKVGIKRFFGRQVVNAVLIERNREGASGVDPVRQMADVVDGGESLIIFPEGTRNMTDEVMLPFKSGIYRLALECPDVEFVPVWVDNLNRVMPKGESVPVPLICHATFGTPITVHSHEDKDTFLMRAREALLELSETQSGEVQ